MEILSHAPAIHGRVLNRREPGEASPLFAILIATRHRRLFQNPQADDKRVGTDE
jgi:hypothetical protein